VARERLLATDMHFGGTTFEPGSTLLGRRIKEPAHSDTFIWASYQLRDMNLEETLHPNHRLGDGHPLPLEAPWFHVGSLSGGHGYTFLGYMTPENYAAEIASWQNLNPVNAVQRLAWWHRVWRAADGAIPAYHRRYGEGLEQLRRDVGIPEHDVHSMRAQNDALISWYER
jgi:hypothetical protein